jgi:hypothetical protein
MRVQPYSAPYQQYYAPQQAGQGGQPPQQMAPSGYPGYYPPQQDESGDGGMSPQQAIKMAQDQLKNHPVQRAWNWLKQNWLTVVLVAGGSYAGYRGIRAVGGKMNRWTASIRGITPDKQLSTQDQNIGSMLEEIDKQIVSICAKKQQLKANNLGEADKARLQVELEAEHTKYDVLIDDLSAHVDEHNKAKLWQLEESFAKANKGSDSIAQAKARAELEAFQSQMKRNDPYKLSTRGLLALTTSTHGHEHILEDLDRNGVPYKNVTRVDGSGVPEPPNWFDHGVNWTSETVTWPFRWAKKKIEQSKQKVRAAT